MLWVDTFTDYFTPEVGHRCGEGARGRGLLRAHPDADGSAADSRWSPPASSMPRERSCSRSVTELAETAHAGVPIVGLEPSCTAVFRSDAVDLLGNGPGDQDDVVAVSDSVRTLAELLGSTDGWQPPKLAGLDAVVQPHCHHRAVLGFEADLEILGRAGVVPRVVAGCCGLAGNFGAERGHYDVSVAIAGHELLPAVRASTPNAPVLTDGFSCRTQLRDVTGRDGIHLAELLACRSPGSRED